MQENNKFAISDIHFSHVNIIKYDNRPFKDIQEHDEINIANWNKVVEPNEDVYYLGDFCFSAQKAIKIIERLNGNIHFIKGNHDFKALNNKDFRDRLVWVKDYYELKYKGQMFCMFHFPILEWNKCHRDAIHLHGHVHGNLIGKQKDYYQHKVFDMGVNLWDYTPVNLDAIINLAKNKKTMTHH